MAIFSVSYDLNKKDKNYDGLYKELQKSGYAHIMDSTWLIHTTETTAQLYHRLRAQTDDNDFLFISKVARWEYAGWLQQTYIDWIDKHIDL